MIATTATLAGCATGGDEPGTPGEGSYNSELAQGPAKQHCVVASLAQPQDGATPTEVNVAPAQCFATFPEAIAAATSGRVQLSPSATLATVDDRTLNGDAATPNASFVIGIEYENSNYGGATLTITSNVTCNGYIHWISSMPSGWNDVISSARAYSNCNHSIHFEDINLGGASVDCHTGCSYVGNAMNDRTSSIRWTL